MNIIEAYILARKLMMVERKVNQNMEKIKAFVMEHKKEILVTAGIIFVYRVGFKHGCRATDKAVSHLFEEAAKAMQIKSF